MYTTCPHCGMQLQVKHPGGRPGLAIARSKILKSVKAHGGKVAEAARSLGISRASVYKAIKN